MNLKESVRKSLRIQELLRVQELYKSMMYHLQHDAGPEPPKEAFGADELEKLYGSKAKPSAGADVSQMHQTLTSRGFSHMQDGGYSHYKNGDHLVTVNQSNGQWIKTTKGKGRTVGSGSGDLARYFKQYGNR